VTISRFTQPTISPCLILDNNRSLFLVWGGSTSNYFDFPSVSLAKWGLYLVEMTAGDFQEVLGYTLYKVFWQLIPQPLLLLQSEMYPIAGCRCFAKHRNWKHKSLNWWFIRSRQSEMVFYANIPWLQECRSNQLRRLGDNLFNCLQNGLAWRWSYVLKKIRVWAIR